MAAAAPNLEALLRALAEALPEVARDRLQAAVATAAAQIVEPAPAAASDDTGEAIVDRYLERVAAAPDADARAALLRELSDVLEREHEEADRALSARLRAFEESPLAADLGRLQALARWTGRWNELDGHLETVLDGNGDLDADTRASIGFALAAVRADGLGDAAAALAALEQARVDAPARPDVLRALADAYDAAGRPRDAIDVLAALADVTSDVAAQAALYAELVTRAERLGDHTRAAEAAERVLAIAPCDAAAHDTLARIYRDAGNWPALADVLARRASRATGPDRVALVLEVAVLHDRQLGDGGTALDYYRQADALEPGRAETLAALVRLLDERALHDEARDAMARLADVTTDELERARLCRRIGELDRAAAALERAAGTAAAGGAHSALLCDAAELCAELIGQRARMIALYRAAHVTDDPDPRAAVALADLYWDDRAYAELVPVLRGLVATTTDLAVRAARLRRLATAGVATGEVDIALDALVAVAEHDPGDIAIRGSIAELAFAAGHWAHARRAIEAVLEAREAELPRQDCAQLHFRAGRCARELGDLEAAKMRAATALALTPDHREARLLQAELEVPDATDPRARIAYQLELAHAAPPDERAALLVEVGDLYIALGDAASARAIFGEALVLRPTDHKLLTKCLDIITDQRDWADSLDVLERIIATEPDLTVRARYAHLAAQICRDELDSTDDAAVRLWQAVDTDPGLFDAADDLEALLVDAAPEERAKFYYRRLEQLQHRDARDGEAARLWDGLADACLELGKRDDAACALDVATRLDPAGPERRQRLADIYISAGVDGYDKAIAQHQEILRATKDRVASYEALLSLYMMTAQYEKARACDDALAIITPQLATDRGRSSTADPMVLRDRPAAVSGRDWVALTFTDVDRLVSALVARVAPILVGAHANKVVETVEHGRVRDGDPRQFARVFRHVTTALGIEQPPLHLDPQQAAACRIALRSGRGGLGPVVVVGAPALDTVADDRTLAFAFARRLADLQPDRLARVLCPRAGELARIIELALAMAAAADPSSAALDNTGRWLAGTMHPVDLDQVVAIGGLLRQRGVDPAAAAQAWLAGTERVGDRIGVVLAGDLTTCIRAVEREAHTSAQVVDLAWTSVTEEAFAVRARLEAWPIAATTCVA